MSIGPRTAGFLLFVIFALMSMTGCLDASHELKPINLTAEDFTNTELSQ